MALHYGTMLRECIRHQIVARYVLESEHVKKFFDYIQLPNFDIAADAAATFKELLTRHKSTVAEFLSKNYDWMEHSVYALLPLFLGLHGYQFFASITQTAFESEVITSPETQAIKLLGDILLDRSNSAKCVLRVKAKHRIEAFHVSKLFACKQEQAFRYSFDHYKKLGIELNTWRQEARSRSNEGIFESCHFLLGLN
ncbi:hypothetical protein HAX54_024902 [Datura stramonium]|uniref:Uncharacterized protein n=1 Tax=Datura stramonium TaxID=4076 RepID=A0ABS8S609_DATST|nr:hypothetical protein [Datura stramonium]